MEMNVKLLLLLTALLLWNASCAKNGNDWEKGEIRKNFVKSKFLNTSETVSSVNRRFNYSQPATRRRRQSPYISTSTPGYLPPSKPFEGNFPTIEKKLLPPSPKVPSSSFPEFLNSENRGFSSYQGALPPQNSSFTYKSNVPSLAPPSTYSPFSIPVQQPYFNSGGDLSPPFPFRSQQQLPPLPPSLPRETPFRLGLSLQPLKVVSQPQPRPSVVFTSRFPSPPPPTPLPPLPKLQPQPSPPLPSPFTFTISRPLISQSQPPPPPPPPPPPIQRPVLPKLQPQPPPPPPPPFTFPITRPLISQSLPPPPPPPPPPIPRPVLPKLQPQPPPPPPLPFTFPITRPLISQSQPPPPPPPPSPPIPRPVLPKLQPQPLSPSPPPFKPSFSLPRLPPPQPPPTFTLSTTSRLLQPQSQPTPPPSTPRPQLPKSQPQPPSPSPTTSTLSTLQPTTPQSKPPPSPPSNQRPLLSPQSSLSLRPFSQIPQVLSQFSQSSQSPQILFQQIPAPPGFVPNSNKELQFDSESIDTDETSASRVQTNLITIDSYNSSNAVVSIIGDNNTVIQNIIRFGQLFRESSSSESPFLFTENVSNFNYSKRELSSSPALQQLHLVQEPPQSPKPEILRPITATGEGLVIPVEEGSRIDAGGPNIPTKLPQNVMNNITQLKSNGSQTDSVNKNGSGDTIVQTNS